MVVVVDGTEEDVVVLDGPEDDVMVVVVDSPKEDMMVLYLMAFWYHHFFAVHTIHTF